MPYNIPNYTQNDISFGPGLLYLGASGATPTVDVGAIAEDGITVTLGSTKRKIMQGNPRVNVLSFAQEQSVMVKATGIEWDFTNLSYALGAGNTSSSASLETFTFGGDPAVSQVALRVRHAMALAGDTMFINVWKAQSESDVEFTLGQDEHQFPYTWGAINATTDWAGNTLAQTAQLVQFVRQLT